MIDFVEYSRTFLEKSWEWLNDKEIKKLTMTPDFTREQQEQFFNSLPSRTDYFIRGITYNSIPVGVCGLKNITKKDAERWMYIGEKEYWGQGIGKETSKFFVKIAHEKKLESLYGKTYQFNERMKNLYTKFGYSVERIENGIILFRLML